MNLTGKAKEQFEEWFLDLDICQPEQFWTWYDSMKYGVYVDWFDSVGDFEISIRTTPDDEFSVYIDRSGTHLISEYLIFKTRPEARTAAIEKANEIFNNRNK